MSSMTAAADDPRALPTRACAFIAAIMVAAALVGPSTRSDHTQIGVVVAGVPGAAARLLERAEDLGAQILRNLPLIDGFSASMSRAAVDVLRADPTALMVSPDRAVKPMSLLGPTPVNGGLMSDVTRIVGAQSMWARGYTGQGVDVAVIDTGVAPVAGFRSRIVNGPDLSFDYQGGAPAYVDAYGHGTHMAGIIAGRDDSATASAVGCTACYNSSGYSDPAKYVGVAPNARIVNVKVGASDGGTDVSQVIAALDWVAQYRTSNGLNIRVVNLSYGTDATQDRNRDPLVYAVEAAWRKGLFVVVAAGNDGTTIADLANPAKSKLVYAAGASDPLGTLEREDDRVPAFAQRGTTLRHVDAIAPGVSIKSLAVPGSFIATNYPATFDGRFIRGTGTSQGAAVTSGVAALLIGKYPTITPDGLKTLLNTTAYPIYGDSEILRGHGLIDAAVASAVPLPLPGLQTTSATGAGTLEGARGTAHIGIGSTALTGEKDIFGRAFNATVWASGANAGTNWNAGKWNGNAWSGSTWTGTNWNSVKWSARTWTGQRWSSLKFSSMTWNGQRWSGNGWNGQRWSGGSWDGQRWSGQRWSGNDWS